jgi:hypothetical protein
LCVFRAPLHQHQRVHHVRRQPLVNPFSIAACGPGGHADDIPLQRTTPITISGRIATRTAPPLFPEILRLIWLGHHHRQGGVGGRGQQRLKYSFHVSTSYRMNATTIPGRAIGITMVANAPDRQAIHHRGLHSSSVGMPAN